MRHNGQTRASLLHMRCAREGCLHQEPMMPVVLFIEAPECFGLESLKEQEDHNDQIFYHLRAGTADK